MRTVVVLPEPFWPRKAKIFPSAIDRSIPSTALMSGGKCLVSCSVRMAGMSCARACQSANQSLATRLLDGLNSFGNFDCFLYIQHVYIACARSADRGSFL